MRSKFSKTQIPPICIINHLGMFIAHITGQNGRRNHEKIYTYKFRDSNEITCGYLFYN
jgi:hypothetical protein